MSLSYVVDGFTELGSALFNPIIDRVNGLADGTVPIALTVTEATASGPPLPPELFAHNFFKIKTATAQSTTNTQFIEELRG